MCNGLKIGSHTYTISAVTQSKLTASGFQKLIDNVNAYVTRHGLSLCATKCLCSVWEG